MEIKTIFSRIVLIIGVVTCFATAGSVDEPFEVGTWANFCKGAVSHTFDDNCGNQLSKGVPMFDKLGFHMTMFSSPAFNPNYGGLKNAFAKGHEIGSHGTTHSRGEANFAASQKIVQDNVPGEKCVSYAYPNCDSPQDKSQSATKTYLAARNCSGYPNAKTPENWDEIKAQIISPKFDYSISGVDKLNGMADAAIKENGWSVYLHHGIDGDHDYSTSSSELQGNLDYLDKNRDKVWCETFGNVARYIKERDAVTVKKKESDNKTITVAITDDLDDKIFNFPLSIRLPVEETWDKPSVKQADKEINDTIITVDGKEYLMFQAVPDGGDVVITTGVTTGSKNRMGFNSHSAPVTRIRSSLVINRQEFSDKMVSVTLFNLAGKTIAHHTLGKMESSIDLQTGNLTGSAFIAKVTDGVTTYSHLFMPTL